jgi:hypothetical protein
MTMVFFFLGDFFITTGVVNRCGIVAVVLVVVAFIIVNFTAFCLVDVEELAVAWTLHRMSMS